MHRNSIALVWLAGIAFAALLYLSGPGRFVAAFFAGLNHLDWAIEHWIGFVAVQAFDLVRAAAIALFAVFLVLGAAAAQRGRGSGLVGVTLLFLGLVWIGGYQSRFCWFAALLVAGAGAVSMTQRLLGGNTGAPWRTGSRRSA